MSVDVSVIVCTHNRAEMLGETLASWRDVDRRGLNVELMVVDNASGDATPDIVARFQPCCAVTRYVRESVPGLSRARNRGIREAHGEIIAFVDDDVFFHRDWLQILMRAFRERTEVSCVGGNSIPRFEGHRPEWLAEPMLTYYGSTQSGDRDRLMTFPEHPFGVNMAFRRQVFERVGWFRTNLGRTGASLLSNEERELFYRIAHAGINVWYAADAIIYHRIPADRMSQAWLIRRAYWQGISKVVFDAHTRRPSRIDLGRDAVIALKRLALGSGHRDPGSIVRYHRRRDLGERLKRSQWLGTARQSLVEIFRGSAPR